MPSRTRVTTRGRLALAAAAVLALTAVVVVVVRSSGTDCSVTTTSGKAGFDRDQAESAAILVAEGLRSGRSTKALTTAVEKKTDLSADDAAITVAALTGTAKAALVCEYGGASRSESDTLGSDGLTARAETVRKDLAKHVGDLPLGGFAPGGVHSGHMPGSAHYEGRAIDVFFRPITAANKKRGWAAAQYLVASADRLEIETVIFDGRIWTARRADEGWRDYSVSHRNRTAATIKILEHRDHVHVDVAD